MLKKPAFKVFFGLITGASILYLLKDYRILPIAMLAIGLLVLIVPAIASGIDHLMSWLIAKIGLLISAFLLLISFFLVLTPIALISRIFGKKDSLGQKIPETTSFIPVNKSFDPQSFEKMW